MEDFVGEVPNTLWTWVNSDEGYSFEEYIVNCAKAGDTDSIMLSFPEGTIDDLNKEEITEIADEIASITNESFPEWVIHAFNVPEERKDVIQTDREIVSDSSLFLSKKRYVMRVVNDEGKWVNKLKIMGVEIKKSDVPAYVQDCLLDLSTHIINGGTREEGIDILKNYKDNFSTQDLKDIARPISVKGLKFYNDEYEMTGSEKGFPYNVRAARYYNSLCGPSDRKIMPGEKVGILYIKSRESKYIAFPIDINEFPSFMNDIVIDYKTQWEKAHKKIVSYMSAVGWDFQSQKEEKREKLFGF